MDQSVAGNTPPITSQFRSKVKSCEMNSGLYFGSTNNRFKASLSQNAAFANWVRRVLWTTSFVSDTTRNLCLTRQELESCGPSSPIVLGALPPPAARHALRSSRRRLHRPNPLERYEHTADRRRRSPRVQRAAGGSTRRCLHQLRLFPPADRRQPATTPPAAAARPTLRRRSRRPRSHCHRVAALAALYVVADHLPLEHRFAPSFATPVVDAARGSPLELRRRDRDPADATAAIVTSLTPLNQS